jgi:hypothetical protein
MQPNRQQRRDQMTTEWELDPADYHLRLMIEQMQRDGRSEDAIERAVRVATCSLDRKRSTTTRNDS